LLVITTIVKGGIFSPVSFDVTNYLLFITIILFFIGAWASQIYSKTILTEDPKEVIIDEVVGQLMTIIIIITLLPNIEKDVLTNLKRLLVKDRYILYSGFIGAFILFRIFDILKPFPINYIDKNIKNGFGIMLDDVIASIMASISFFIILYMFHDHLLKFFL
jgi:phosphatidylglycerophosphatase A